MSRSRNQAGFTLTEVLIAVAIFAIIFVAALMVYDRSNQVFQRGVISAELQQNTRVAFDKVVSDLRMTGFDFDRDGTPTGTSSTGAIQYQQPDEQFEYIGPSAVVIRGNFNYEFAADNGAEPAYLTANEEFPLVTTSNEEIVGFVLKSANASANTDSITYYADVSKPRATYPGADTQEREVEIDGIDLSMNNPPYTLYRVHLTDTDAATPVFVPIAENVRSINFTYYEDSTGSTLLTDLDAAPIAPADVGTAVGGQGQYDWDDPVSSLVPRAIREKVRSVRFQIVGMDEAPDMRYTDPDETVASAQQYRKYRLESLVVPRNYGRRGFRESTYRPPGVPTITRVCVGYCGVAYVEWTPPGDNPITGSVESYTIYYSTDTTDMGANSVSVGPTTSGYAINMSDPAQDYYFIVSAVNRHGSNPSTLWGPESVENLTTPSAPDPASISASLDQPNAVILEWATPNEHASGTPTCSSGTPPAGVPIWEVSGFRIYRSTTDTFDETTGEEVLNETSSTTDLTYNPITRMWTWIDRNVVNCTDYYYRIQTAEKLCSNPATSATFNAGGATGLSTLTAVVMGRPESDVQPSAPSDLQVDLAATCISNSCTITMQWPRVTTDVNGGTIRISEYILTRTQMYADTDPYEEIATETFSITPETVGATFTAAGVQLSHIVDQSSVDGRPYRYAFSVQAKQCEAPLSDPSPIRYWPCEFGAGNLFLEASVSITIEGQGTLESPWLTTVPAVIEVDVVDDLGSPGSVESMRLVIYDPDGGPVYTGEQTGPMSSASFPWPDGIPEDVIHTINITAVDSNGCTAYRNYYAYSTSNNCCLTPFSASTTVMVANSPNVTIVFENNCTEDLVIAPNGIRLDWTVATLGSTGQRRMNRILYPPLTGSTPVAHTVTTNSSPVFTSPPTGALTTIPAGGTYTVTVVFDTPGFTPNASTSPITRVCVSYLQASQIGTQTCKIVPVPSNEVNICD